MCQSPDMDFGVSDPVGEAGQGNVAVIEVWGELDIQSVPLLEAVLVPVAGRGGQVILDGTGLTFTDSTGVSLFLRTHRDAMDASGRFDLVVVEPIVLRVLELSGLIGVLNIHETVAQARQVG